MNVTVFDVEVVGLSTYKGEFFRRRYIVKCPDGPVVALEKGLDSTMKEHRKAYKTSEWIFTSAKVSASEEVMEIDTANER